MNSEIQRVLYRSTLYLKRHSPFILSSMGAVGVIATAVMAVGTTPKAINFIHSDSMKNHNGDPYAYSKREAINSCWRCYIPATVVGLSAIACIFGANALNKHNQASLASAYTLLSQSHRRYRDAAKEVYGEDADSKIQVQMVKDVYVSADGYSLYSDEMDSESNKILCHDLYSQRYFTAPMAAVLNAQYHINRNFALRGYVSINEFYDFIGLDKIAGGDEVGWSAENLVESGILWLDFENRLTALDGGMECCVISAIWEPSLVN